MLVNIKVNDYEILNMLDARVENWTKDEDIQELYSKMYENFIYGGYFEGCEFDVMQIVDNDYINYCTVIEEGDPDFEEIKKYYNDGFYDISCETNYSFIESTNEDQTLFLVRY